MLLPHRLHGEDESVDSNQNGFARLHQFSTHFGWLIGSVVHIPSKDHLVEAMHVMTLTVFVAADERALLAVLLHAHHGYLGAACVTA
jgi:hypothetical protein